MSELSFLINESDRHVSVSEKFPVCVCVPVRLKMMAFGQVVLLFLNYCMVVLVAGQSELDKDVEIIPGKTVPQAHPLDAKFAPQYANDIYGQPVS